MSSNNDEVINDYIMTDGPFFFSFFQTPLQRSETSETCRLKNYFGDQFGESDLFCSASVLRSNEEYLFIYRLIFTVKVLVAIVTPC